MLKHTGPSNNGGKTMGEIWAAREEIFRRQYPEEWQWQQASQRAAARRQLMAQSADQLRPDQVKWLAYYWSVYQSNPLAADALQPPPRLPAELDIEIDRMRQARRLGLSSTEDLSADLPPALPPVAKAQRDRRNWNPQYSILRQRTAPQVNRPRRPAKPGHKPGMAPVRRGPR